MPTQEPEEVEADVVRPNRAVRRAVAKSNRATLARLMTKAPQEREVKVFLPVEGGKSEEATLLFRSIGAKEWDSLVKKYPPNHDQRADGQPFNTDTFGPALLARVCVEPEISESDWKEIWDSPDWNRGGDAGLIGRVTLQSFDWRTLQIAQGIEPALQTVYLSIQTANNDNIRDGAWTAGFKLADHGSVPRMVKAAGGAVWSPNAGALTEALLREAQALGLKVIPWTVNAPADMQRFLDWGVDGLITDYPDRLREVMRQRGLPLPKGLKN